MDATNSDVIEVRGHGGEELLTVCLPSHNEAVVLEAALEEWGWSVDR
jgi:hypothetical protein